MDFDMFEDDPGALSPEEIEAMEARHCVHLCLLDKFRKLQTHLTD